jgi:predicted MFS family arabinose efflux permease
MADVVADSPAADPGSTAASLGKGIRRGVSITVLAVAMGLGILPMFSLGVLAPFLIDDLDISRASLGLLVTVVAGVSAILSPLMGAVADRIGDRVAVLAVVGAGAAGMAFMAASPTFLVMCAALAVAGLCRAGANPSTNRMIAGRLPLGRRGWITAIKQTGETVAIVFAAAALPVAADEFGWRAALLIPGAIATVALVAGTASIEGSVKRAPVHPSAVEPLRRSLRSLYGFNMLMGVGTGAMTAYLPLYAHERGGLSAATAGAVMIAAGLIAGIARLATSRLSELRWGFPNAMIAFALVALGSCAVLLAAPELGSAGFWVGAALWGTGGLGFGAISILAVMAEAGDANTGRSSGFVVFWFSFGLALAPPLFGLSVDSTNSYALGLTVVGCLYLLAALIMFTTRGWYLPVTHLDDIVIEDPRPAAASAGRSLQQSRATLSVLQTPCSFTVAPRWNRGKEEER